MNKPLTAHSGDVTLIHEASANGQLASTSRSTAKDASDRRARLREQLAKCAKTHKSMLEIRTHIGNVLYMFHNQPEVYDEYVRRQRECTQ